MEKTAFIEVREMILSETYFDEIDDLLRRFSDLDSITKQLQDVSTTICQAGTLFHGMMKRFPRLQSCLSANATVVENSTCKNTVVKFHIGREKKTTGCTVNFCTSPLEKYRKGVESETGHSSERVAFAKENIDEEEEQTPETKS